MNRNLALCSENLVHHLDFETDGNIFTNSISRNAILSNFTLAPFYFISDKNLPGPILVLELPGQTSGKGESKQMGLSELQVMEDRTAKGTTQNTRYNNNKTC